MKSTLYAFLLGALFALGLGISGMTDPNKVLNFLDLFGQWDPSLALVMVGAIGVSFWPFKRAAGRLPPLGRIESRLIVGSVLFGIGWGLSGFCPGPAITSLAFTKEKVGIFVAAMVAGFWIHHLLTRPPPKANADS